MPRGIPKKNAAEMVDKLHEIDPDNNYIYRYDNWKKKHIELVEECNSGDSLMSMHYQKWLEDVLEGGYGQEMLDMAQNAIREADNPFAALMLIVEYGLMPPPTLVYLIDELFRSYTLSMGHYSWEEICFGKPVRGIGNYAARYWSSKADSTADFDSWVIRKKEEGDKSSLQGLAEAYFESKRKFEKEFIKRDTTSTETTQSPDIENFLRTYRRSKTKGADT